MTDGQGGDQQQPGSGRPPTPGGWREAPKRLMHMSPLVVSLGAMLVFALVVGFVVVLPLATFEPPPSPNAVPLSDAAWRGKQNFQQQGCNLCHSGFSRPQDLAAGQYYVYSRVSEPGDWPGQDYTPNLFGTIRTGPDLANEGGQHPDDWQRAHYFDPRYTTPLSIMPRFSFWSDARLQDAIAWNAFQGGKAGLLRYATLSVGKDLMKSNMGMTDVEGAFPELIRSLGSAFRPTGKNSDKSPSGLPWMAVWMLNSFARDYWLTQDPLPVTDQNLLRGKEIFQMRCAGCHGVSGNGNGPAAQFLVPPPFNFTDRSAMLGPTTSPGMLYHRILTAGPGTAMENFGTRLSVEDIWRVVLFLRTIPGGSLARAETLPTPQMFLDWTPPPPLMNYIKTHPIEAAARFRPDPQQAPFLSAAHWLSPGMVPGDVIYVGGKLPMTLDRLQGEIRRRYFRLLDGAYREARARGSVALSREQVMNTEELAWAQP